MTDNLIEGRVTEDGEPVEDAVIAVLRQLDEEELSQEESTKADALLKLTDADGEFVFDEAVLFGGVNEYHVVTHYRDDSSLKRGAENYAFVKAEGSGTYVEAFTTIGAHTWEAPEDVDEVDVLVVGGGGGGGASFDSSPRYGGGGGAGGVVYEEGYAVPNEPVDVVVGHGGSGSGDYETVGQNGEDSEFDELVAIGGGGGGSSSDDGDNHIGEDGASGGGGGGGGFAQGDGGDTVDSSQGHEGVDGTEDYSGGGGGVGGPAEEEQGGPGIDYSDEFTSDFGNNGIFGEGGNGKTGSGDLLGEDAVDGSGSGGGGARDGANDDGGGGDGGSGIVLVKYESSAERTSGAIQI